MNPDQPSPSKRSRSGSSGMSSESDTVKEQRRRRAEKNRKGFTKMWKREMGSISPRKFTNSILGSEDMILSLELEKKLQNHNDHVNTLCFNNDGTTLLSGSRDRTIVLWDWETGSPKHSLDTLHTEPILSALFLSQSNDTSIITCGDDGQVIRVDLSEGVTSKVLANELEAVNKMAIDLEQPNMFYACTESGLLVQFDLRESRPVRNQFRVVDSSANNIPLFDIAIDPTNPALIAVAGSKQVARIYDIRLFGSNNSAPLNSMVFLVSPPISSIDSNSEAITGLAYSNTGELLLSYHEDNIYLLPRKQVNSSPNNSETHEQMVYKGHSNKKTFKGVYFLGPSCEYVASGSDSGHTFIWRKRDGKILRTLNGDGIVVNCIQPHPLLSVLATSGTDKDINVWASKSFDSEHSKRERQLNIETVSAMEYSSSASSASSDSASGDGGTHDGPDSGIHDDGSRGGRSRDDGSHGGRSRGVHSHDDASRGGRSHDDASRGGRSHGDGSRDGSDSGIRDDGSRDEGRLDGPSRDEGIHDGNDSGICDDGSHDGRSRDDGSDIGIGIGDAGSCDDGKLDGRSCDDVSDIGIGDGGSCVDGRLDGLNRDGRSRSGHGIVVMVMVMVVVVAVMKRNK